MLRNFKGRHSEKPQTTRNPFFHCSRLREGWGLRLLPGRASLSAALILLTAVSARPQTSAPGGNRLRLAPRLSPGQTLRYELDFRSRSNGFAVSNVQNPQAAREVTLSLGVRVRVEVLGAAGTGPGPAPKQDTDKGLRLRTTYEKIASDVRSDTPDPVVEEMGKHMAQLEGKSFEFTLDKSGHVRNLSGLEDFLPEQVRAAQDWLEGISPAEAWPEGGAAPGEKWAFEQDARLPLVGVKWVRESTYLRNEPCRQEPGRAASGETCAVILTRGLLTRKGGTKDATPLEYRQKGLHTSGSVEGTNETLTYVSLTTGLVVSVTQTGTQKLVLTVGLADGSNAVSYDAEVKTESQLSLISQSEGNSAEQPAGKP